MLSFNRPLMRPALLLTAVLCSGCASPLVQRGLDAVGVTPTAQNDAAMLASQARGSSKIPLRIHAAEQLNVNNELRSLSIVVRIYHLKRPEAFAAAPYTAFGDTAAEAQAFGSDLVHAREIVLKPGQHHDVLEPLTDRATHLAVVALFRAPAADRWRFIFDAPSAARTGVTLGVHGCAMSVAQGSPVGAPVESLRLAGVRCK